jgi:hypothetical protein
LQQIYADTLLTYRFSTERDWSWWRRVLPNQHLTAYIGPGWLFFNHQYFARPDNTGLALFLYVAHFDLDLYKQQVVVFGDVNMFTDRQASSPVRPSELDYILGIAFRWRSYELSTYMESDQPVDRGGLVQKYWAVQLRVAFDVPKRLAQKLLKTDAPTR